MRHREFRDPYASVGEFLPEPGQGIQGAGEHGVRRAVHGGHDHLRLPLQGPGELVGSGGRREHAATRGQFAHQPGPPDDQPGGLVQVEGAGGDGRGVLAEAVAEDGGRGDAEGGERTGEGVADGEQGGLGELGPVHALVAAEDQVAHRGSEVRGEGLVGLGEVAAVGRGLAVQPRRHSGVLAALAGEEEGRDRSAPGAAAGGRAVLRRRGLQGGRPAQLGHEFAGVAHGGRVPVREAGLGPVAAPAQGGRGAPGAGGDRCGLRGEVAAQRLGGVGAEGEDADGGGARVRTGGPGGEGRGGPGCGAEDGVGVGAPHAEAADPGEVLPARQPHRGLQQPQAPLAEPQLRVLALGEEAGGDDAVVQGQRGLDEPGDAGGALGVAQVALDGADRAGGAAGDAVHRAEGRALDGVAEHGSGAVGLHEGDPVGGDPGAPVGGVQHPFLRPAVGGDHPVAAAVLVDGAAAQYGVDPLSVGEGVV